MWSPSPEAVLKCVYMQSDVYLVCLQHALSTEKEEVMGLLIGEINEESEAHIAALVMLRRSDKRKDRVEISPEQLSGAAEHAEKLAEQMDRPLRVIGWYHSHPHITVWPSHVDVRTQFNYQMMDQGFVGIIFSVFSEDKASKEQEVQVTCFQSVGEMPDLKRRDIDLHIIPTPSVSLPCLQWIVKLPEILVEEEKDAHDKACRLAVNNHLGALHNHSELAKALCHITELVSFPLLTMLENLHVATSLDVNMLKKEKEQLQRQLDGLR